MDFPAVLTSGTQTNVMEQSPPYAQAATGKPTSSDAVNGHHSDSASGGIFLNESNGEAS